MVVQNFAACHPNSFGTTEVCDLLVVVVVDKGQGLFSPVGLGLSKPISHIHC